MKFPSNFICATYDYADFGHEVPAPYLRRSFQLTEAPLSAELLTCTPWPNTCSPAKT